MINRCSVSPPFSYAITGCTPILIWLTVAETATEHSKTATMSNQRATAIVGTAIVHSMTTEVTKVNGMIDSMTAIARSMATPSRVGDGEALAQMTLRYRICSGDKGMMVIGEMLKRGAEIGKFMDREADFKKASIRDLLVREEADGSMIGYKASDRDGATVMMKEMLLSGTVTMGAVVGRLITNEAWVEAAVTTKTSMGEAMATVATSVRAVIRKVVYQMAEDKEVMGLFTGRVGE